MEDLQLTELQLALMRVLWTHREVAVSDVHAALHKQRGLALTTVATILSRLERAGLVARRQEGRHFVYRPLVSEEAVRRSMVSDLAERLFQGDVTALVSHVLSEGEIAPGDLEGLRRLIDAKQRGLEPSHHPDADRGGVGADVPGARRAVVAPPLDSRARRR